MPANRKWESSCATNQCVNKWQKINKHWLFWRILTMKALLFWLNFFLTHLNQIKNENDIMMNIICASCHTEMIWINEPQHQYAAWHWVWLEIHIRERWQWNHVAVELALILNSFFATLNTNSLQNCRGNIKAAEAAAPWRVQTTHLT